jgi:glucose-1-phosphate cytidylyltransferase
VTADHPVTGIILCGGFGTRLHPRTLERPKALLPIGTTTPLDLTIGHFARYRIHRVMLCAGFKGERIFDHVARRAVAPPSLDASGTMTAVVGTGFAVPSTVSVIDTGVDTPTGGRLVRALANLPPGEVIVAYSDILSDVNLDELMTVHRAAGLTATLTAARARSPYGHVSITTEGLVTKLAEKPRLADWVNIGFIAMNSAARACLAPDSGQLEYELLPRLASAGQLAAFRHGGHFEPMDTVSDHDRLCRLWESDQLSWLGDTVPAASASSSPSDN